MGGMVNSSAPRIFIGSSTEHLGAVEALQILLSERTRPRIWRQGFGLSQGYLEALVAEVKRADYAVMLLAPDDILTRRDVTGSAPRDNVIFELGLFIGALGRDHVFMVRPRQIRLQLPSDLEGLVAATYDEPEDGDWMDAMGVAAARIIRTVLG
jgi:predicted nucleotide-binding protein